MGISGGLRNFIFTFRDFLLPYIPLLRLSQYDFAFLVHPRDVKDVYKEKMLELQQGVYVSLLEEWKKEIKN